MFANQLKAARRNCGHTQSSLSNALGVSKGTVAMWETGKRHPSLEKVGEISDLLGVSTDFLIKGNGATHLASAQGCERHIQYT